MVGGVESRVEAESINLSGDTAAWPKGVGMLVSAVPGAAPVLGIHPVALVAGRWFHPPVSATTPWPGTVL